MTLFKPKDFSGNSKQIKKSVYLMSKRTENGGRGTLLCKDFFIYETKQLNH